MVGARPSQHLHISHRTHYTAPPLVWHRLVERAAHKAWACCSRECPCLRCQAPCTARCSSRASSSSSATSCWCHQPPQLQLQLLTSSTTAPRTALRHWCYSSWLLQNLQNSTATAALALLLLLLTISNTATTAAVTTSTRRTCCWQQRCWCRCSCCPRGRRSCGLPNRPPAGVRRRQGWRKAACSAGILHTLSRGRSTHMLLLLLLQSTAPCARGQWHFARCCLLACLLHAGQQGTEALS